MTDYVTEIVKLIQTEADQHSQENKITSEFIENTHIAIEKKIRILEENIWQVPHIDETSVKHFFATAKKHYLCVNPIKIEASSALTKPGFETWLTDKRDSEISWQYLDRYLVYKKESSRSEKVLKELERSSKDILGKLGDPSSPTSFFKKGLVVGEVQSGKTENFNAVINRAIDSGYQLIIILSGIMEDLRVQTQDRVESEVIGSGSIPPKYTNTGWKGVGIARPFGQQGDSEVQQIESVTSRDIDFGSPLLKAGIALNAPKIFVCKKNVSILKNIINGLSDLLPNEGERHTIPVLILDDEADNASLNNEGSKGREYASKVNGHIRAILGLFDKKSYLGYTATPFANVLQDHNDSPDQSWVVPSAGGEKRLEQVDNLFPDDFIVLLDSPTNYIGAKKIFDTLADTPKLPLAISITDYNEQFPARLLEEAGSVSVVRNFPSQEDWAREIGEYESYNGFTKWTEYRKGTRASKRHDDFPQTLPRSLKDAVLCFILSTAVREIRKLDQSGSKLFEPHNSMLIHISRFITWQNKTASLVRKYVGQIIIRVENDTRGSKGSIFIEFENVWNTHFTDIISNIRDYLPEGYVDPFMAPVAFSAVLPHIASAIEGIDVLAVNSSNKQQLQYPDSLPVTPLKIIAIGGNRLSRGFTMKGLTINYFIRPTNYSDTLLQMGRWFGYRPGYLDCCRVFTTPKTIENFNSTTRVIEELETEFKKMEIQGKSPENFLIRVRKHPSVLQITRPSIMKNTTSVRWSYEDMLVMTSKFDVKREKIESVWEAFKNSVAPLFKSPDKKMGSLLTTEIRGEDIVKLLRHSNNFEPIILDAMINFIQLCQIKGKLTNWTIVLKATGQSKRKLQPHETNLPCETGLAIRSGPKINQNNNLRGSFLNDKIFKATGGSSNIMTRPQDMAAALDSSEIKEADDEFRELKIQKMLNKGLSRADAITLLPKTIPEHVYRERLPETQGTLIIYLFDSEFSFNHGQGDDEFDNLVQHEGYNLKIPLVGYAIGFPPIKNAPGGVYVHTDYINDAEENDEDDSDLTSDDLSIPNDEVS